MYTLSENIVHCSLSRSFGFKGRLCFLLCFLSYLCSGVVSAQVGNWRYDTLNTTIGSDLPPTFNPQTAIDRWGVTHFSWVTRDPNSAGLQVYHTQDQTNEIGAPFLLTDTGTVYDSLSADSTSYRFLVDHDGIIHLAFLANVFGSNGYEIGIYYTNDRDSSYRKIPSVLLTKESGRYSMAVDSNGTAHLIWLENVEDSINVHYWNSQSRIKKLVKTVPCGSFSCQFSDPELQVHREQLEAFVRNASGAIYQFTLSLDGNSLGNVELLPVPLYDQTMIRRGDTDLRLRAALDSSGSYHLLIPMNKRDSLPSLFYGTNTGSNFSLTLLPPLDSTLMGFDIATDGAGNMASAWTTFRGRFPADLPKTGFAGYSLDPSGVWDQDQFVNDLNSEVTNPDREWRVANRIVLVGQKVHIIGERYNPEKDMLRIGAGLFTRSILSPETTYMLPDAAAPGMSLVVETFAPIDAFGAFGPDTLDPVNVGLELVNPEDSSQIIIGPSVVSWEGRLLSTMLFVHPEATPQAIPLRVRRGDAISNPQMFSIVLPQRLGVDSSGKLEGDCLLGSGGIYGRRSRRGVLVVDTLILSEGTFRADVSDPDPETNGEQGMLPLTILAKGEVIIDSTAVLSVSAPVLDFLLPSQYGRAGPGGGGGGAGLKTGGGVGYTAGGAPSDSLLQNRSGANPASGGSRSGRFGAGGSLNGAPGGAARMGVPSGGGTGHPFGSSGRYGRDGEEFPFDVDAGGFGGGTGGKIIRDDQGSVMITSGGGGGGFASSGGYGGPTVPNGGRSVGSTVLVPLAGGSGGGGAYSANGRVSGGGGGGAIALYSYRAIHLLGRIEAKGADGVDDNSLFKSGGGGGAGGGVLLGAQGGLVIGAKGQVIVEGGAGGDTVRGISGGDGGKGRVRVDGLVDGIDSTFTLEQLGAEYFGPASNMNGTFQAESGSVISGVGVAGTTIRIYIRPEHGVWSYGAPKEVIVDTAGHWSIQLEENDVSNGLLYVATLQKTNNPSSNRRTAIPSWIMSTAGGAIVGQPGIRIDRREIDYGCVPYSKCDTASIFITNTGTQSDLVIKEYEILHAGTSNPFVVYGFRPSRAFPQIPPQIAPGLTAAILIRFCPARVGNDSAILRLFTNVKPDSLYEIRLRGCGIAGKLHSNDSLIDLGDLCPGDCRDTALTLTNKGEAPLDVTGIATNEKSLKVERVEPPLPITIKPEEERELRIRVCLRGGGGEFIVSFRATTPLPSRAILLRIRDIGPDVSIPLSVNAGLRDIGADDTCRIATFTLRNRSSERPLTINSIATDAPSFEVLTPRSGASIPPGGKVEVVVRFCGDTVDGSDTATIYRQLLLLSLGSGSCILDTTVALHGSVFKSKPKLDLNVLDKVDFGEVIVRTNSAPRKILIVNQGDGIAKDVKVAIEAIFPTDESEITATGLLSSVDIAEKSSVSFNLVMTPAVLGTRQGRIIFSSASGWQDTVLLCVEGVESEIVADTLFLDFGDARVRGYTERPLRFFNRGTAEDSVMTIEIIDSILFGVVSLSSELPMLLAPVDSMLTVRLRFSPADTGPWTDSLRATTRDGRHIDVTLAGVGLLEKAETNLFELWFPCSDKDGIDSVQVTNAGTWPLTVERLIIEGESPEAFVVLDPPRPDILQPDQSRFYRIRYLRRDSTVRALLRIEHSGQDTTTVELESEPCELEEFILTFSLPEVRGHIDSVIWIPLSLKTGLPLPEDIPFRLILSYEPTLLMPAEATAMREVGAINVDGEEDPPGELTVSGMIPEATGLGVLLEIPMRVLLGRSYRTDLALTLQEDNPFPPRYRLLFDGGTFIALDCDTTGTIDLGGVYAIKQSVPNPAGSSVRIDFEVARSERVRISLHDAKGTVITTLLDNVLDRGEHSITFDVSYLSAGFYYYEIRSGRYRAVQRMVIVE